MSARTSLAAALLGAVLALNATAQSIVIPDFRRPDPAIVSVAPGECKACGRIQSVRQIAVERRGNVPAQLQGDGVASAGPRERNLVGAVMVLPFGPGSGQPYVGGVGTEEMKRRLQDTTYELVVQLDDGTIVRLEREDGTRFRVGDRVRVRGTADLELIAG